MRSQITCLAIILVLVCSSAAAQMEPTSTLETQRVPQLSVTNVNVFLGTPRPFHTAKIMRDGLKRTTPSIRKSLSSQSQIYVIDTAIVRSTRDTARHLYSFNAEARRTSDLTQIIKAGLWVDSLREMNTFDARNNMLSELHERWENGQWVDEWRRTFTYDASSNMLSDLYEGWSNGHWVSLIRNAYTYDANGNVLSWLWESLPYQVGSFRYTYTYDANGNMVSFLYEAWSGGQWDTTSRRTYYYDVGGIRVSCVDAIYSNGGWYTRSRNTYTYDANGKMLSDLMEDFENGQWVYGARRTYSYDVNGNMLSNWNEVWSDSQWVYTWCNTNTYDANGKMLSLLGETGCGSGELCNSSRRAYAYDAIGNLASVWNYRWTDSSWTLSDMQIEPLTDSAGNIYVYDWFYNVDFKHKIIVTEVQSKIVNVPENYILWQNYPNPFNPSTNIQFSIVNTRLPQDAQYGRRLDSSSGQGQLTTVKVYDMLGREVAVLVNEVKDPGTYTVQFDASNLASGVYIYRLQVSEFTQAKRLVILR